MSLPTTTSIADPENPKLYPPRSRAFDCFLFLLLITVSAVLICAVPVITRGLVSSQPGLLEFNVTSSSLAILNVSSNSMTANWDVILAAKNPSSKSMSYNEIKASALKGNESLYNITIANFEQTGNAQSSLQAVFDGMFVLFDNCTTNNTLGVPCEAVNLTMELQAKVKYEGRTWPIKRDSIKVVCIVKVDFPSNVTTLMFGSSSCDVYGHWNRIVTKGTTIFWCYIYVVAMVLFIFSVSL